MPALHSLEDAFRGARVSAVKDYGSSYEGALIFDHQALASLGAFVR